MSSPTLLSPIARGEAKSYTFEFTNADGTAMNLTGKKIVVTLRLQGEVAIEKKSATVTGGSDDQIQVTGTGLAKLKFALSDTSGLEPCRLDGDLWVYTDATDPVRVAKFTLPVEQAQTRAFP